MKITKQMLLDKEACSDQVELFVSLFGEEAKVTKANCLKAWKAGIDFNWAANNLLSPSQRKAYLDIQQPAWKAYKAIEQPAWKAYGATKQPALEAYLDILQPAWEAYLDILQPAWEAYKAIEQPAWKAYKAIEQPALKAYMAIEQPALEAYRKWCALAFYTALKGDK